MIARWAVTVVGLALAGCAAAPAKTMVIPPAPLCPVEPPAPPGSKIRPPPPPSFVPQMLEPGHWEWQDDDFVWVPAHWVPKNVPGKPIWRSGFWLYQGGGCAWQYSHWLSFSTH